MNRRRLRRFLGDKPSVRLYKPQGKPMHELETVVLTHEEWEALRLKYAEDLDQHGSAKKMQTSQSTLQRILASAQKKVGRALVLGWAIKIED